VSGKESLNVAVQDLNSFDELVMRRLLGTQRQQLANRCLDQPPTLCCAHV
jgi:hypothetical protein